MEDVLNGPKMWKLERRIFWATWGHPGKKINEIMREGEGRERKKGWDGWKEEESIFSKILKQQCLNTPIMTSLNLHVVE